jgi:hypothetical protein
MKIIKVLALIVLISLTLSMKNNHRRRTSNGPSWEIKKIDGLSENLFVEYRSGNAEQTKVLSLGEIYINGKPDTKSLCFEFPEDIMNKEPVKSYHFLSLMKEKPDSTKDKYFCYNQALYDIDYKCNGDHSKSNVRIKLHFKARNSANTDLILEFGYGMIFGKSYHTEFFKHIQLRVQDYPGRDVDCYPSTKN